MQQNPALKAGDIESEYRKIEAALLEGARGRWFLAEHGRRSRRLDSTLLEEAIGRLSSSLNRPPAVLDQLKREVGEVKELLAQARADLAARKAASRLGPEAILSEAGTSVQSILRTVEDMHEIAWSLQGNELDPKGCETLARQASRVHALSRLQAEESTRTKRYLESLEAASQRLEAVLQTIELERDETLMPEFDLPKNEEPATVGQPDSAA